MLNKNELFFFLKTGSLIINHKLDPSLSLFYKHIVSERLSSQSNKIWNQENGKIFVNLEKPVYTAYDQHSKNPRFESMDELAKVMS